MKIEALVKMANQISDFFAGEAGEKEAPAAVATHLRRYWEPRMRRDILSHYDLNAGEGLDAVALKAVALLAAEVSAKAGAPKPP